jgi:GNAT superfamily N-acetyltransferase
MKIQFLEEPVDEKLDAELRELLTECFGHGFSEKRFATEMPRYRWIARDDDGQLIAHVAAHEKSFLIGGLAIPMAGIAEVCVHPSHRSRGLMREMLNIAHVWLAESFDYAALFGVLEVYQSSGYALRYVNHNDERVISILVRPLRGALHFPDTAKLTGPRF